MRPRFGIALMLLAAGCTAEPQAVAMADAPAFTPAPVPSNTCAPTVRLGRGEAAAGIAGALMMVGLSAAGGNVKNLGNQGVPPPTAANGQRC